MGPTIGIFSRAGEEEYKWLISWLRSVSSGIVVRPFYISNNNGQRFREEVSKCTVAILYHSKKRGRVNLTDVTDSLYDEELEYLSAVRGNANVFVVIDDLDDSGSESKNRILTQQPKIRNLASDVFLFTWEEKDSSDLHNSPKLNAMRELVNKGAKGRSDYFPGPYPPGPSPSPVTPRSPRKGLYWLIPLLITCAAAWYYILNPDARGTRSMVLVIAVNLIGSSVIYYVVFSPNTGPRRLQILCVSVVTVIEVGVISGVLSVSVLPSVALTILTSGTGVWIIILYLAGRPNTLWH